MRLTIIFTPRADAKPFADLITATVTRSRRAQEVQQRNSKGLDVLVISNALGPRPWAPSVQFGFRRRGMRRGSRLVRGGGSLL